MKEHERLQTKETTEKAFPLHGSGGRPKSDRGPGRKYYGPRKSKSGFKGKCFKCNQVGHMKRYSPGGSNGIDEDAELAVGENRFGDWLIDSDAT